MRTPSAPFLLALAVVALPSAARAADYFVPSISDPTIQVAVGHAALDGDALCRIFITQSPVHSASEILIGPSFTETHRLLIRPDATLGRATIVGDNASAPIVEFNGGGQAGFATFEDLDLVRDVTNNHHLIQLTYSFTNIVFDRCRIGSVDTGFPGGDPGWNAVEMDNPVRVMFRNCILFSYQPGTFERGFHVSDFSEDVGSLFLYNNDVADYGIYGIHIADHTRPGTIVLRNNVVANSPAFPATSEPTAFRSEVDVPGAVVLSSGNATFAADLRIQSIAGAAQSLIGTDLDHLPRSLLADPTDGGAAFKQGTWDPFQGPDANPVFFHLWPSGALHNGAEDVGTTVLAGSPDFRDIPVTEDIDHDPRPSGAFPGHTDRGADQVERDNTAVGEGTPRVALEAAPLRNPSSALELAFRAGASGRLLCEVFDVAGRRVLDSERLVSAGESGRVAINGSQGVVQYRIELVSDRGRHAVVAGRAVILR